MEGRETVTAPVMEKVGESERGEETLSFSLSLSHSLSHIRTHAPHYNCERVRVCGWCQKEWKTFFQFVL